MGTYVPAVLRRLVSERAAGRCEYCRYPEEVAFFAFEIEHIISEKHGGPTTAENLTLACPCCNRAKGTDLGSLDPTTGQLTPFFNPRTQLWHEHFSLDTQGISYHVLQKGVSPWVFCNLMILIVSRNDGT